MAATIIAAVDDSPAAAQVVRLLAGYQGDREAVSVVLLGVQPPAGSRLRGADLRSLEEARDLVAGAGLAVETTLRTGAPADEIVRAAADRDAAMIVIGRTSAIAAVTPPRAISASSASGGRANSSSRTKCG
jgi:nucleotide-binding universal stress UspA family protein